MAACHHEYEYFCAGIPIRRPTRLLQRTRKLRFLAAEQQRRSATSASTVGREKTNGKPTNDEPGRAGRTAGVYGSPD